MGNFAKVFIFLSLGSNVLVAIAAFQAMFASKSPFTGAAIADAVDPVLHGLAPLLPRTASISDEIVRTIADAAAGVLNAAYRSTAAPVVK